MQYLLQRRDGQRIPIKRSQYDEAVKLGFKVLIKTGKLAVVAHKKDVKAKPERQFKMKRTNAWDKAGAAPYCREMRASGWVPANMKRGKIGLQRNDTG